MLSLKQPEGSAGEASSAAFRRRRRWSRIALVLAGVLLLGGLAVGVLNREVLDESRFARHVNALRSDPAVAARTSELITAQVLRLDPDLIVIRPLVQTVARQVVQSSAFDGIVVSAVRQFHRVLTQPHAGSVLLRLADVGAVLVPVLRAVAPQLAAGLPPDFDVTLASIGAQDFAGRTIDAARTVGLLAWLLPLLALVAFVVAILLAPLRRRGLGEAGLSVVAAGLGLGALGLLGAATLGRANTDTVTGALVRAGWAQVEPTVEHEVVAVLAVGVVIAAVGSAWLAGAPRWLAARWRWLRRPPLTTAGRVARAAVLVAAAAVLLVWGSAILRALPVLAGLALLAVAVRVMLPEGLEPAPATGTPPRRSRRVAVRVTALASVAVLVLAAVVAVDARPSLGDDPPVSQAAPAGTCNGFAALCGRAYNDVAYAATHNSMSVADQPGWLFAEQPDGLVPQLQHGVRALLFDTWLGQPTNRRGVVVTASGWYAKGAALLSSELGQQAVASAARVRDALGLTPTGPPQPYLCHGLCENGSTLWEPDMVGVRQWLHANPREVVTFIIQDEGVTPAQTDAVFRAAGLLPYVYTHTGGQPWPTLAQLISSGHRLVVFMENQDGGTAYPWQMPAFTSIQDTPYTFHSADQFSCARLRGEPDSPLLLINHWLSSGFSRITDSAAVNSAAVLWPRVSQCETQRRQLPNFVAVDFYDLGDVFEVVDRLNGTG